MTQDQLDTLDTLDVRIQKLQTKATSTLSSLERDRRVVEATAARFKRQHARQPLLALASKGTK